MLILDHIREFENISNKEARVVLGLADSTTKRILKQMVDSGKIAITGERKSRRYIAIKDNKA